MRRAVWLLATVSLGVLASPGIAQDAPPGESVVDSGTPAAGEEQEILVTGSRITRRDYVSDSPISTVGEQLLETQGPATIAQTLGQLPQFTAIDGAPTASAAKQGRASANLRGLGITRTLVLLDGRRLQPSDALGSIDLNIIPNSLIGSVEVITGGASATYGSDAIAGVVNFKLKQNVRGVIADAQMGITERGDGRTIDASLTSGLTFGDGRGSLMGALSFYDREGVFGREREHAIGKGIAGVLRGGVVSGVSSNLPSQAALNAVFIGRYGATTPPLRNQAIGVNRDGTLFTSTAPILNFRYPDHDPYILDGASRVGYPLGESYYLSAPLRRYSGFVRGEFELSPAATLYAQGFYTRYRSSWTRNGNTATSATAVALIPVTNPFIPADLKTILASRPNPTAPINFSFNTGGVGPTVNIQRSDVWQALGGIRGDITGDISYDLYASFGRSTLNETQDGYIDRAAFATLVNAADGGASVCPGGYNPFSPDPLILNPEKRGCYEFLNRTLEENNRYSQQIVEGTVQGSLFELPAGRLQFAVGAGYRRNAYDYRPDAQKVNRTIFPDQATGPASGSITVKEAFAELLVPILRDVPVFQELTANLAYRYSDYDSIGGVHTYKATGDWNVFGGFRVRGGYQRAVRAPNLAELYAAPERSLPQVGSVAAGAGDFCDATSSLRTGANAAQVRALCLAQGVPANVIDIFRFTGSAWPAVSQGNLNLKAETADTIIAGITWSNIFSTPVLSGLSLSVDYYDISVDGAIGQITPAIANNACFNRSGGNPNYDPTNYYCTLIRRDATSGQVDLFSIQTQNLGAFQTSGIDAQLDWTVPLDALGVNGADPGRISLNLVGSWLDTYKIQNTADAPFNDYAGTIGNAQVDPFTQSYPEWKATGSIAYDSDAFGVTLRGRYYGAMDHFASVGVANSTLMGVESRTYWDLSARFSVADRFDLRAGINNLFDTEPPEWVQGALTDPALYDQMLRRFFVGVTTRF